MNEKLSTPEHSPTSCLRARRPARLCRDRDQRHTAHGWIVGGLRRQRRHPPPMPSELLWTCRVRSSACRHRRPLAGSRWKASFGAGVRRSPRTTWRRGRSERGTLDTACRGTSQRAGTGQTGGASLAVRVLGVKEECLRERPKGQACFSGRRRGWERKPGFECRDEPRGCCEEGGRPNQAAARWSRSGQHHRFGDLLAPRFSLESLPRYSSWPRVARICVRDHHQPDAQRRPIASRTMVLLQCG